MEGLIPIDTVDDQYPSFDFEIQVWSVATLVSYSDAGPLLDELNKRYAFVRTSFSSHEPPAADFSEIAFALTVGTGVGGALVYFKSFLEAWAAEDAKALRSRLANLTKQGWQNKWGRRFVPFTLSFGTVRFLFHEQLGEDEMLERIKAASELLKSLPEEAFELERIPGGGGEGLYWDKKSKQWLGVIGGWGGEHCFPDGVLSEKPGDIICLE
ncbi:MAG: hypothetical protein QOF33_1740 [Thermomicrobiales bacterium]|nr:hypothetical protein [Thermomicrobiales bacterium]